MKVLVVYYSLTGTTKDLAESLAAELNADLEEVVTIRSFEGFFGYIRAAYGSVRGAVPEIASTQCDPSSYDLIVAGGPLWAGHCATPLRAYLEKHRSSFKDVAFFLTFGGSKSDTAFSEMEAYAGRPGRATLRVKAIEIMDKTYTAKLNAFKEALAT